MTRVWLLIKHITHLNEEAVYVVNKPDGTVKIKTDPYRELYPHYFRLNRAMIFASQPATTLVELMQWFGWKQLSSDSEYMGRAGRTTKGMAERLG